MELDKKIVAKRIKNWANANFSTLKEMAEKTGISYNALQSTYLNAKSLPGTNILAKLSKHGLDINWLLSEEDTIPSHVKESSIDYQIDSENIMKQKDRLNEIIIQLLEIAAELKEVETKINNANSESES